MNFNKFPRVGMRKVKSAIAVVLSFFIWQLVRIPFPQFEIHPLFGYIYAVSEMRPTVEDSKKFGWWRIKATLIGISLGLCALPISISFGTYSSDNFACVLVDIAIFVIGVLIALSLADWLKCGNMCGLAAMIFLICLVRDRNARVDIYLYAILRVIETLIGVFSAWFVNNLICARRADTAPATAENTQKEEKS